ncbi:MAG: 2-polyprenylphenol 6-hydroxylase, partial [Rhodospirillaceae bacterium]
FAALGPSFIKFGQTLSTRADLLGEEIATDLSELQDAVAPFPMAAVRKTLETDFDQPIEDLFYSFEETPVAAASIAQVHFAITKTPEGEPDRPVAVKILRPGVEETFLEDVKLLHWIARLVEMTQPSFRRLKPVETAQAFEDSMTIEMDLRFEAAAACELAENFEGDPHFRVPGIDWQRTSQRVLTIDRVVGLRVDEPEALREAGIDPLQIVEIAANAFFNMVFRDGFFHADLHPGNMFVEEDGTLVAVDFGIMGRIGRNDRRYLGEMLLSFLTGNYRRAAEVHFEAGWVPADKSVEAFTQACRSIAEPIFGKPLNEISVAKLLGQLFQVTETFEMQSQPQLLLLQKSMLITEGVGRKLAPEVNMWELSQPLIESWIADNMGPQAKMRDMAVSAGSALEKLPRILSESEKLLQSAQTSGVKLSPETLRDMKGRRIGAPWFITWFLLILLIILVITN